MSVANPAQLSLSTAADLIRTRQLSPVELVETLLGRIARFEPHLNAYITVCRESALSEARAAEAEIAAGRYRGPLHGIPMAIKDLINTAGVRTTHGSKIFSDFVPGEDAAVMRKLGKAGSITIGKTNLHEFASGGTTINPHYGPTRNPWDLDRIPGGSSGGSAAVLAAHLCTGALGTDTGGSIRGPAFYCGIVGLKPTYGLVSRNGVFPLSWSLDHVGPMAKTVTDAALILNAIAGYDPQDPSSANTPPADYTAELEGGVRGIRIGVLAEIAAKRERVNGDVWAAFEAALKTLEGEGATIKTVSVPTLPLVAGMHQVIMQCESYSIHEALMRERAADYGEDVRSRLQVGGLISAAEYIRAQRLRGQLKAEFGQAFKEVDLVALPTMPVPAPTIAEAPEVVTSMALAGGSAPLRLTPIFDHTGQPAISVPAGFSSGGLPIGVQLAGPAFADSLVLRAARTLERALALDTREPKGLLQLLER